MAATTGLADAPEVGTAAGCAVPLPGLPSTEDVMTTTTPAIHDLWCRLRVVLFQTLRRLLGRPL